MAGIQEVWEDFFYDQRWTQAIDGFFIKVLAEVASHGGFWVGQRNMHAMLITQEDLRRHCGRLCGLTELRRKLETVEQRYDATKFMMDHPLVRYDNHDDEFIAPDYVWNIILLVNAHSLSWFIYQRIFLKKIKFPHNLRSFYLTETSYCSSVSSSWWARMD